MGGTTVRQIDLCKPWQHRLSRRQWLAGAAGLGPLGMSGPVLADELKKKDKQVLFIWLDGGMSQLESWDPKPNTQFGGPFRAIPTSVPGIHVSRTAAADGETDAPSGPGAQSAHAGRSHSSGVARIQRGDPKNRGVFYPFFGSAVSQAARSRRERLAALRLDQAEERRLHARDAGFLGPKYGALAFGDGKPPENLLRPKSLSDGRRPRPQRPARRRSIAATPQRRRTRLPRPTARSSTWPPSSRSAPICSTPRRSRRRTSSATARTKSAGTCCWRGVCWRPACAS